MAYRRTPKMQQRVLERRRAILVAAEELFAEKGYESTSMKEVAMRASTSIGNMYFYFSNKEDLMRALLDKIFNEIWHLELNPEELTFTASLNALEALDDYLKIYSLFQKDSYTRILQEGARHYTFRRYMISFLEGKTRERYQQYDEFFEGLDRELALSYHLGGLVNMFEKVLTGDLDHTPHQLGVFLAQCKLYIRGLDSETVTNVLEEMRDLIPEVIRLQHQYSEKSY